MLDFWRERQPVGRLLNVDVSLINDLYENWRGEIRLRLLRGDAPVVEQVQPAEVPALGASRRTFVIPLPDEPGAYRLEAALPDSPRGPVRSLRDLRLVSAAQFDAEENLAFQCNATASSWQIWEGRALEAGLAVDGVEETHWSSRLGASHWLAVDLGRTCRVSRATIIWSRSRPGSCALDVGPMAGRGPRSTASNRARTRQIDWSSDRRRRGGSACAAPRANRVAVWTSGSWRCTADALQENAAMTACTGRLAAIAALAAMAVAAEYHVSPAGRDDHPGTAGAPFRPIQRAADAPQTANLLFESNPKTFAQAGGLRFADWSNAAGTDGVCAAVDRIHRAGPGSNPWKRRPRRCPRVGNRPRPRPPICPRPREGRVETNVADRQGPNVRLSYGVSGRIPDELAAKIRSAG